MSTTRTEPINLCQISEPSQFIFFFLIRGCKDRLQDSVVRGKEEGGNGWCSVGRTEAANQWARMPPKTQVENRSRRLSFNVVDYP